MMEAKRSQSISNCVHLYEALPTTKSVPMLLHTVSSILPGISSGNSACSHRLSGKSCCESRMCFCVCTFVPLHLFVTCLCLLWYYLEQRDLCLKRDLWGNPLERVYYICIITVCVHVKLCLQSVYGYVTSSPIPSLSLLKNNVNV